MCFVSVDACRGFALIVGSLGGCDIISPLHHHPLNRSHLELCVSLDTSLINNGERGGVGVSFIFSRTDIMKLCSCELHVCELLS